MRKVLLDAGPIVHFAGVGVLSGKDMCDVDAHVFPAGCAIIIEGEKISSIIESAVAEDEFQKAGSETPWLILEVGVITVFPKSEELTPQEAPV